MARVELQKLLSYSYLALCLAGLLYQVAQLSQNFFSYQVVTEIKVSHPIKIRVKHGNICFNPIQVYDKSRLEKIQMNKTKTHYRDWSIEDRFEVAVKSSDLFIGESCREAVLFIAGKLTICYQFHRYLTTCLIHAKYVQNVTVFAVSMSNMLPYVDPHRFLLHTKPLIDENHNWTAIWASASEYQINKLAAPYTDKCHDYQSDGYVNRIDAVTKCYITTARILPFRTVLDEKSNKLYNYSFDDVTDNLEISNYCNEKYRKLDCNESMIFTQTRIETSDYFKRIVYFSQLEAQKPSFHVLSKAKIESIDYFSLLIGTMGTWLGISILNFNPVNLFPKKKAAKVAAVGNSDSLCSHSFEEAINVKMRRLEDHIKHLYSLLSKFRT